MLDDSVYNAGIFAVRQLLNDTAGNFNSTDGVFNSTTPPTNETGIMVSCDQESQEVGLWYVGVILSIVASILGNLGVNTQKYSMIQEELRGTARKYMKQPLWMLGMVSVVVGAVMDFAALGFAAQSLITPVGGFTMVANLVFAHFWLKEKVTYLDLFATFLIVSGIILVAAFADKRAQCFTLDDLLVLYQRDEFIMYAIVVGAMIFLDYLLIRHIRSVKKKYGARSREYLRYNKIQPVATAALSALFGAQSVLFAKSTIELFKISVEGDNQFLNLGTYLIVGSMLLTIFMQIHWLATGLQDFDATLIVPVFQSIYTVGAIISGAAYFDEFRFFNTLQQIMFPIGVVLIVGGVQLLTRRQKAHHDEPENLEHVQDKSRQSTTGSTSGESSSDPPAAGRVSRHNSVDVAGAYGAITGRYVPALMIWNELPDVPDFPELSLPIPKGVTSLRRFTRHPFSSRNADNEFDGQVRRMSLPELNTGRKDSTRPGGRIHRSFAHVENQLMSGIGGLTRSWPHTKKQRKLHEALDQEDIVADELLESLDELDGVDEGGGKTDLEEGLDDGDRPLSHSTSQIIANQ